jgi:hypothetical protein
VTTTRSTRPLGSPNVRVSVVTPFAVSVVITEPSAAVLVAADGPEVFAPDAFVFDATATFEFALPALVVTELSPHPAANAASASAQAPHKNLFNTFLLSSIVST